jgi:outer membrane protein assembly factor BamB
VIWSRNVGQDYKAEPPVWGWSAHPLLDGDKLICLVGGEGSAVVAFDKSTGKELWKALAIREIGYAPPIVHEHDGRRQLIVWHTEAVNSLDPETGKLHWSQPFPEHGKPVRPGITVATPRQVGELLMVSSPHHGSLLLNVTGEKPQVIWRGLSDNIGKADGLHCLMSTPFVKDGHIYGICSFGELRCLKLADAQRLWETYDACLGKRALFATSFLTRHEDRFFIFTELGDLILARLTPKGYEEISRAHLLEPLSYARGRMVLWSPPAFANRCLYARNDKEIICVSLAEEKG